MIEILAPGPLATVQDRGRVGFSHLGVGRSGAADLPAHDLANRLVGNGDSAATIEVTFGGLHVRFHDAATIALTGAPCATRSRRHVDFGVAVSVAAGTELALSTPGSGLRSYLAVRGGIDVPVVLGSRATDTLSGLGPAPLRAGDRLDVGCDEREHVSDALATARRPRAVRIVPGPRTDWFVPDALQALTLASWQVDATSNRIGVRLLGPALDRSRAGELVSEPTLPGAIQVPPNGQPIVLGPDAPVTGGYPVIAVVHSADLGHVFQLRPGDEVGLQACL